MQLAAIIVLLLVAAIAAGVSRTRHRRLPPGPSGIALAGNWMKLRQKARYLVLAQWSRLYGDFFSYRLGLSSILVVSGADAFEEVFTKKGPLYNTRPLNSKQSLRVTGDARGVALPYGEPWKDRRKVLQTLLTGPNAKVFLPYQDFESKVVLRNLLKQPSGFYEEMIRYSSSVTFSMLLGARFEHSDSFVPKRIREEMTLFWQHITPGSWITDWLPVLDLLPDQLAPWRAKADRMRHRWVSFWSLFFDRMSQKHKQGTAPDCFLDRFLDQPDVGRFSHMDSVGIVAEILSAGTETTITSLQWFFRAGVFFPEAFALAREEIDRVVGRDRLPGWEDRQNLPYVEAFIQELHRWASVSPLAVPHATTERDDYRGFSIPKGMTVIANTYAVHHDPQTYPEPEKFVPARFLPVDHPLRDKGLATLSRHYAFGLGRRVCPGLQVANSSLYIVISRILWGFDIAAAPSGPPKFETLPSPLVIQLAPFDCAVTSRDEMVTKLITMEIESLPAPAQLESASVYEGLVAAWDDARQ